VKEYNLESGDFSLWGELEAGEDGEEFVQDWNSTLVKTLRKNHLNYAQNIACGSSAPTFIYQCDKQCT
jgi:hypothetical protein